MTRTNTTESGPGAAPALRLMRATVHGVLAVLLVVAVVRTLTGSAEGPVPLVVGLAVALGAVYAAGMLAEQRFPVAGARAWLVVVIALWGALVAFSADFSWLAFPLFFLCMYLFPVRFAIPAVVVLTGGAIGTVAGHEGLTTGVVLGPVIGAAVATLLALVYAGLYQETQRRQGLIDDLVRTRADLAASQRESGILAERERLAREIHDTVAQGMSSVLLLLRAADSALPGEPEAAQGRVREAEDAAASGLAEARRFVHALAPPALDRTPLGEALRRLCEDNAARFRLDGHPVRLPTEHEVALLRVAQGALANAAAHASATRIDVTLGYLGEAVVLDVFDDGHGFDPGAADRPRPTGTGYGLRAMRDRVTEVGGALTVESAPGEGTAVAATVPVPAADEAGGAPPTGNDTTGGGR